MRRRGWLSRERFLDLLGATNLIPGPNSTEMAIHVGHERAGWRGLVVAGVCFIAPAFLIVLACAWAYTRYGTLPAAEGLLRGVKPVIIAIVLQALWGLGRTATRTRLLAARRPAVPRRGGGRRARARRDLRRRRARGARRLGALRERAGPGERHPRPAAGRRGPRRDDGRRRRRSASRSLFLVFLKIGSVLFGSGYVLLAFLRADLVVRRGWLTESQLLDAVAVGQVTPGPVFTTATFVGYLLGGVWGAVVATVGIFLPAFVFVALSGPLVPRIRRSPVAGAFLDGVNVASIALMALVTAQLARAAIVDPGRRRRGRERRAPPPLPREPGVARARRRPARPRPPPLARASLAVEVGHERRRGSGRRGGGAPRERRATPRAGRAASRRRGRRCPRLARGPRRREARSATVYND